MNIASIKSKVETGHIDIESLAGNKSLSEDQKIAEASRQFEAIMVRQFLSESQKPVIKSSFTDDSSTAGIYQDMITNPMADSLTHSGGIGLAKTFEQQLTHHHSNITSPTTISKP